MRLSELGDSISEIVGIVGIVCRVKFNMNSYFGQLTGKV
jgi:hypothetical protein